MKYIKTYEEIEDKSFVQELDLSYKNLTELPDLSEYTNLKVLYCRSNKLTSLPELPKTLKVLYCDDNQLTSLPELPDILYYLDCSYNNLPFRYFGEYKKWYKENKHIIDKEGLEYAYDLANSINKYNI